MPKRITIKDVAKHAEVSFKTVSNVLNNTGSMRPDTRKRVEDSIKELGYTVNVSARSLKKGSTELIGLGIFNFSQPFAPYLADKVIEVARDNGYGTIISTYGSDKGGLPLIMNEITQLGADGWLLFTDQPLPNSGAILDQPFPIVLAGDFLAYDRADLVTMSNTEAMRFVTGKLLDSGIKTIGVMGAPNIKHSYQYYHDAVEGSQELRIKGYLQAFNQRGLDVDWNLLFPCDKLETGEGIRSAESIVDGGKLPEVLICLADALALGALHGFRMHNVHVPDDIQIIGFDNVPESGYSSPSLTTIDPLLDDYVKKAVSMLIQRIEGYKGPARIYKTGFKYIERGSTSSR